MPALSRSPVWMASCEPSGDHDSCVGSPLTSTMAIFAGGATWMDSVMRAVAISMESSPLDLRELGVELRRVWQRREGGAHGLHRERGFRHAEVALDEGEVRGKKPGI